MPAEQMSAVRKMKRFAGLPGIFSPMSFAMGTSRTLAMVWLMNVETTCRGIRSEKKMGSRKAYQNDPREYYYDSVRR